MTDADKVMNTYFGSDLVDIRIRIQINAEIWIRISEHFWLRFWVSAFQLFLLFFLLCVLLSLLFVCLSEETHS